MFPFGPFPGKGHPLMLFDRYDPMNKEGHLKYFRYFMWAVALILIASAVYLKYQMLHHLHVENFFQREYYISDERYYLFWTMDTMLKHLAAEEIIDLMDDINHFVDTKYRVNELRGDKRMFLQAEDPLPDLRTTFRHHFKSTVSMMYPEFEIVPFEEKDEMFLEVITFPPEEAEMELSDDWY